MPIMKYTWLSLWLFISATHAQVGDKVVLPNFAIDRTEVTIGQFERYVKRIAVGQVGVCPQGLSGSWQALPSCAMHRLRRGPKAKLTRGQQATARKGPTPATRTHGHAQHPQVQPSKA